MQEVKFRLVNPDLRPRRTELEMPGWVACALLMRSGPSQPRRKRRERMLQLFGYLYRPERSDLSRFVRTPVVRTGRA